MWTRTYLALLVVRVYFALSPSYIHPDENFQGPEVAAGKSRESRVLQTLLPCVPCLSPIIASREERRAVSDAVHDLGLALGAGTRRPSPSPSPSSILDPSNVLKLHGMQALSSRSLTI